MILRLCMAVSADPRIELNEIGWLIVLNVTSRTTICRHSSRSGMISRHMLMQRAGMTVETLFVTYSAKWLRMTRFALDLEVAMRRVQCA